MREDFYKLSEEKRLRIINSALEVFGKNEYKRAVTDDIAAKAGVSKGLLFYYFENKKGLYMYLYNYFEGVMREYILDEKIWEITDFFEVISYATERKVEILKKNPYIMDFAIKAFYSDIPGISEDLNNKLNEIMGNIMGMYFKNTDFSKFKEGIEPMEILKMIFYLSDGYMHEKRMNNIELDINEMMGEFNKWINMLKSISYKEELLYEGN